MRNDDKDCTCGARAAEGNNVCAECKRKALQEEADNDARDFLQAEFQRNDFNAMETLDLLTEFYDGDPSMLF